MHNFNAALLQMMGGGAKPASADSSILLLLHFDGADGSTAISDSSAYSRALTVRPSAALTTADKKFGTASLNCNGGRIVVDGSSFMNFGVSDFSITCWAKNESSTPDRVFLFGSSGDFGSQSNFAVYKPSGSDFINFLVRKSDLTAVNTATSTTFPAGFFHVYLGRVGGTVYLGINGEIVGTCNVGSDEITMPTGASFAVGGLGPYESGVGNGGEYGDRWLGKIDEFAIHNYGLYSADFTPPDAPF